MLITASDTQNTLLRYLGGNNSAEASMDIRNAINDALKALWGEHDWPYYQGQTTIQIDAPQLTGTVIYDATTRRFTLSGATWPSWAEYGTIRVGVKNAKVAKRLSDTVIEIDAGTSFTSDIVSASAFVIYRNEYPLENNIRKIGYVTIDTYAKIPLQYVPPIEFNNPTTSVVGTPRYFTIQRDRKVMGGLVIVFWPMPAVAKSVKFCYIRGPREITCWSETGGTVVTASGSTTVTGTGTNFDSGMAQCLLRIGKNQQPITNSFGLNPAGEEVLVDSVASTTSLVCLPAPTITRNPGVKFEISSIVDIDEYIMASAFNTQCYYQLSVRRQIKDKDVTTLLGLLKREVKDAKSKSSADKGIEYAGTYIRASSVVWVSTGGGM